MAFLIKFKSGVCQGTCCVAVACAAEFHMCVRVCVCVCVCVCACVPACVRVYDPSVVITMDRMC